MLSLFGLYSIICFVTELESEFNIGFYFNGFDCKTKKTLKDKKYLRLAVTDFTNPFSVVSHVVVFCIFL